MTYWTIPLAFLIYGALMALANIAQAAAGLVRMRHTRGARHRNTPADPYRNDYQIRRPSRFPKPPKGWAER